jgi:hypothetical protein
VELCPHLLYLKVVAYFTRNIGPSGLILLEMVEEARVPGENVTKNILGQTEGWTEVKQYTSPPVERGYNK